MKIQWVKRAKTLAWYVAMQGVALGLSTMLANIDELNQYISPAFVTILGLVLAQVSKEVNNYVQGKKAEWNIK